MQHSHLFVSVSSVSLKPPQQGHSTVINKGAARQVQMYIQVQTNSVAGLQAPGVEDIIK